MNPILHTREVSAEEVLVALAGLGEDPTAARIESIRPLINARVFPAGMSRQMAVGVAVDVVRPIADMTPEQVAQAYQEKWPGTKVNYVGGGRIRSSILSGGGEPVSRSLTVPEAREAIAARTRIDFDLKEPVLSAGGADEQSVARDVAVSLECGDVALPSYSDIVASLKAMVTRFDGHGDPLNIHGDLGVPAVREAKSLLDRIDAAVSSLDPGTVLIPVAQTQHATMIASLRFYQEKGMGEPDNRSDAIHDLATNGDALVSLDDEGIDALVEVLQFDSIALAAPVPATAPATEPVRTVPAGDAQSMGL
ncbi:hypothetical protein R70006_06200 [Paraburkholderia domus]|nr:hypothetical protein R70006_06200 [Paraburkholderia domus]